MEKFNKIIKILMGICIFGLGVVITLGVLHYIPDTKIINQSKVEKEVTINDEGIADAVEKVYDSVVIVTAYNNDKAISSGSGFVFKLNNKKAYILTNAHVVNNQEEIRVTLTNNKTIIATLEGLIDFEDIAVLSIDEKDNILVANIYKDNKLRVGDTVFAIGGPLDEIYSWTVTRGIVSGLNRKVEVSLSNGKVPDFVMEVLQTDAAINKGNSGGPLCNSNGEVIGITSMKLVSSGVEGMGFAIPIEQAIMLADKIINNEHNNQPYLGIGMLNVEDVAQNPNYLSIIRSGNVNNGVLITEVEKDSAADKAGLKMNDIIVKISNNEVNSISYLRYYLFKESIGSTVKITFIRDGKVDSVNLTIGSRQVLE